MTSAAYLFGRPLTPLDAGVDGEDSLFAAQRLDGAKFEAITFRHCTFSNISFKSAEIKNVTFEDCVFVECYFRGAALIGSGFKGCKFIGCDLEKVKIQSCDFRYYNHFEGCTVPYGEMADSLPREKNLRSRLCLNLAEQSRASGAVRDAGLYRKEGAAAKNAHLRAAVVGSSSWYREKYRGSNRLKAMRDLIENWTRGLLWGHRYGFMVVFRNWAVLSLVLFPLLFIATRRSVQVSGTEAERHDAWFVSLAQVLPGTEIVDAEFLDSTTRWLAAVESLVGLLFAGIAVSLFYKAVSERWR